MKILWLGTEQDYSTIHAHMEKLLEQRIAGEIEDSLLLVEHSPTYTIGRSKNASANILDAQDTPVVQIKRGGDVTYHGPGQLTGYPIVKLPPHKEDIIAYLRFLEEFWIEILAEYGIQANRDERNTGVWVQGKKMVAIGVAFRQWVAWHGFACNCRTDLSYFRRINPCGMDSSLVTKMEEYCSPPDMQEFASEIGVKFEKAWNSWLEE